MHGQGALEYLIIIAAVLGITAVVVAFITGAFSSTSTTMDITQCRLATANCAKDLALGVSTSCDYCEDSCEGAYIDICKTGNTEGVSGGTIQTTVLTSANEKVNNNYYCSADLYVLENDVIKLFISRPPITSGTDCMTPATTYNFYGLSPMRIWSKDVDTTYRVNNMILDENYFYLNDGSDRVLTVSDISQFEMGLGQIIIFPTSSSSYFDAKIIYTVYPGNVHYAKVTLWTNNKDTSARTVYFKWYGDHDPPTGTWFNETYNNCGVCAGNSCAGELWSKKWIAFARCSYNDAYGIIADNPQRFRIQAASQPELLTPSKLVEPGGEYEYSFYLYSGIKGPVGQEWKPVEDTYNSLFGS